MRPSTTVARAALTAVLALGALPGLVGSHERSPIRPVDAALFEQVNLANAPGHSASKAYALDGLARSAGALGASAPFSDPSGGARARPAGRAEPQLSATKATFTWKPPRYALTGWASFYDNGTTAMRDVPRGTTIVICGAGGCIQTVVSDYGPSKAGGRLIDMYRPDFFRICGCGWWSGTTWVTVKVY